MGWGWKSAAIWWFGSGQCLSFPELPQVSQKASAHLLVLIALGPGLLRDTWSFPLLEGTSEESSPPSCVLSSLQPRTPGSLSDAQGRWFRVPQSLKNMYMFARTRGQIPSPEYFHSLFPLAEHTGALSDTCIWASGQR